ncbi:hypothetical protein VTL71DRAFT_12513, partial [Oculimacula yallundae]
MISGLPVYLTLLSETKLKDIPNLAAGICNILPDWFLALHSLSSKARCFVTDFPRPTRNVGWRDCPSLVISQINLSIERIPRTLKKHLYTSRQSAQLQS